MNKFVKLLKLIPISIARRALIITRTAAAVEHEEMLRFANVETIIDVGANKGQFSLIIRHCCPNAQIYAFEPLPEAQKTFTANFKHDPRVQLFKVALGSKKESRALFITNRTDSSSLLMPGKGQKAAYDVTPERKIEVNVDRLDGIKPQLNLGTNVMLKIDVQGGEKEVLIGAGQLLETIKYVYVELSFIELYRGQPLANDIINFLYERNFLIRGVYNMSITQSFGTTQADFLFCRRDSLI